MKQAFRAFSRSLRLLALASIGLATAAWADDYSAVGQLLRANQLPEAQRLADSYLASKPTDPQMRFLKAVIQSRLAQPQDAITTLTQLTEDYPELPEPYNNLAVLYAAQGQVDKARAALEMAIRTNPGYANAHENLGDIYARLASQAYQKAVQLGASQAAVQPKLDLLANIVASHPAAAHRALPPTPQVVPASPGEPAVLAAPPAAAP